MITVAPEKPQTISAYRRPAFLHFCLPLEHGFTLVEVLISAMILFSALGLGTLAYRSSVRSLDSITADAEITGALPTILAQLKTEILERKTEGQGRYGNSITYTWRAKQLNSSKNLLPLFDESTGKPQQGSFTVSLDSVALTVSHKRNGSTREAKYEYQEVSWSK